MLVDACELKTCNLCQSACGLSITVADENIAGLAARVAELECALEDIAEGNCSYGDGCPTFRSRHGQCNACRARDALKREE